MEVLELLETLQEIITEGKEIPFIHKALINPEEVLDILSLIKEKMPEEIKKAQWITDERIRILQEANKEAEDIVKIAEKRIIEMIDEHEITKKAEEKSIEIIEDAKIQSREISDATRDYADSKLADAERSILEIMSKFEMQSEILEETLEKLKQDRKELKK